MAPAHTAQVIVLALVAVLSIWHVQCHCRQLTCGMNAGSYPCAKAWQLQWIQFLRRSELAEKHVLHACGVHVETVGPACLATLA